MEIIKHSNFLDYKSKPQGLPISYFSSSQSILIGGTIEDINEIQNNIIPEKIESNDKLFISKYSRFPSLFISKIGGLDVKRTIKTDKADKVIIDFPLNKIRCYVYSPKVYTKVEDGETSYEFIYDTAIDENSVKMIFGNDFKIVRSEKAYIIDEPKEYVDLIIENSNKLVDTHTLDEYVNDFLPDIDQTSLDNISQLLQSNDSSTIKIGIELLHTFDLSKMYYKVVKTVWSSYNNVCQFGQQNTAAFKHIESMLKVDKRILSMYDYESFVFAIYNNISESDKEVVRDHMCEYLINKTNDYFGHQSAKYNLKITIEKI